MTTDPGPVPEEQSPRTQIHIWVDSDVAEWLRDRAHNERRSKGKTVEAILRDERVREVVLRGVIIS